MDVTISNWISENLHDNDIFNHIMFFITEFGVGYYLWLGIIIMLFYNLIRHKRFSINILLCLIFLLQSYLLGEYTLKPLIKRERPYHSIIEFKIFMETYNYKLPSGYSFPSGHSFSALTVAVSLSLYRKKLSFVLIPCAILVAFFRLFIGAHYFSDILLGSLFGSFLGGIHYFLCKLINKKRKEVRYLCD